MNTFGERLRIIPFAAWTAGASVAAVVTLVLALGPMRLDPEMHHWPAIGKAGLVALSATFLLGYSLLAGFIYADAKHRQMRHVMWTWMAFIPYFLGVIFYFIMRDPVPTPCPHCRTEVPQSFAFCPSCGTSVHPGCANCGRSLQAGWINCPHCGTRIALVEGTVARGQSAPVSIP